MAKGTVQQQDKGPAAWFRQRLGLTNLDYEVPAHANTLPFSLGGLTLINFLILILTGIILAQFYTPNPATANQSIRVLMTEVNLGSFLRGLHFWAAQGAMVTLILHLLRVFVYGSYKRPRELNWLLGVVLFFGMAGLFYTGTILKWDQEAFEALAHTQEAAKLAGVFGFFFAEGFARGVPLLSRIYSIHTSMLPLLLAGVLAGHLLLVKGLKISSLPWGDSSNNSPQKFSGHLVKLSGYGFILLGILVFLAVLLPPDLGPVPVKGIEATKPPWLFLSIFSIENWTGLQGLIWATVLLALGLVVVPFIDRATTNNISQRKAVVTAGILTVVVAFAFTINAYVAKPGQHIGMGEETEQVAVDSHPSGEENHDTREAETAGDKNVQEDNHAKEETPHSEILPELTQLDRALAVIGEIGQAVQGKDFQLAAHKAVELDEILDAINRQIAAKDSEQAADLEEHVHELGELLEKPQPDIEEVNNLLAHSKESVEKARLLFAAKQDSLETRSPELQALSQSLAILDEIKHAVDRKEYHEAAEKATELDEILDAINGKIAAKDAERAADMEEHVHELGEMLEKPQPNISEVKDLIAHSKESVEKAIKLFE